MAKREFIERENLINELAESSKYHAQTSREESLLYRDRQIVREQPAITEQEIVKPYLEKLREQIAKSADKQLKIAMGTADLNERYAHIRVESAFRQCIAMIDNLLSEQEVKE